MKRNCWLLLALAVLACYNAGTVWLIQFSCYPLWPEAGPAAFGAYFRYWERSTYAVVVLPLALAAAGSFVLLLAAWSELPRLALWVGLGLQAAIELVRSLWVQPLEQRAAMLSGQSTAVRDLSDANWILVALVTAYALLALWSLAHPLAWRRTEARGAGMLLALSALGLYAVGNMWLVHFVSYPLWPYVGKQQAYGYHIAWWHSIWGVLFVPAGIVLLGSLVMLWTRPDGVSRRSARAGFALQSFVYIITGAWFAPLMARLATQDGGLSLPLYDLLMKTHWVRFALITAYGVVCCHMLVKIGKRSGWRSV